MMKRTATYQLDQRLEYTRVPSRSTKALPLQRYVPSRGFSRERGNGDVSGILNQGVSKRGAIGPNPLLATGLLVFGRVSCPVGNRLFGMALGLRAEILPDSEIGRASCRA